MKNTLICIVCILINFYTAFSQKNVNPDEEDIKVAEEFKTRFPDDDVAIQLGQDYITFVLDKKNNKVSVEHNRTELLTNMSVRADIQRFCMYTGESEINQYVILYKNNRYAGFNVKDEAFISEDLFHVD